MKHLLNSLESSLAQSPVGIAVELPGGLRLGNANADLRLRFRDRMAVVALAMGEIGNVGAAIVEGRVALEGSMRQLMAAAAAMLRSDPARDEQVAWWRRVLLRARSMAAHTRARDAQHIQYHYDLSDDFYALWLDPRRVYSCAYFRADGMTLAQAQEAKLDHICRKLMLRPGERFLDIGAGWGGLLLWAAQHYGVDATGITLSRNQHAHVQRLIEERGLQGRVRMQLLDYRVLQVPEPFDKIASVGMFEHVGHAQMGHYFATVHRLLRPGGLLMNHGITAGGLDNAAGLGAGMGDFIERYIFPGGELMHVSRALQEMARAGSGNGGHGEPAPALRAHAVGLVGSAGDPLGRGAPHPRGPAWTGAGREGPARLPPVPGGLRAGVRAWLGRAAPGTGRAPHGRGRGGGARGRAVRLSLQPRLHVRR
ncbi:cyclopropane-fatty-acyl-phospholipid synthase [Alicycliphilus sp. B1]|nr:cyclopropane-fatty-acyl-phospholipid synthase [Alicycliphilus sp. B1]